MGFANPTALLLSALLAVLALLYLLERRRRRFDVPSFLLWANVPDALVNRSRFQPDLLFFLQLAILSALILGLARPFLSAQGDREQAQRQIIVLDTSASMRAQEGDTTRFEQAKEAIATRLRELAPQAEVMLITAADRPAVPVAFTRDREILTRTLAGVRADDTGTNLDGALALAVRASAGDIPARVDVFTDLPLDRIAARWRDEVNLWPFGSSDDNLAIESLRVFQGSFESPSDTRAMVSVRNHSAREAHGSLTVTIDGTPFHQDLFSLDAHAAREFPVSSLPRGGLLRAQLDGADGLAVDDTALAWIRTPRRIRALLVSPPSRIVDDLRSIATAGGFLDLITQEPAEYTENPADADLVIFHRFVPDALPARPTLLIFPETANGPLQSRGEATQLEIVDWDTHHPALAGLHLRGAYPLARAKVIDVPPWAVTLVRARDRAKSMPVAFAGVRNGHRTAVLSFDLEAEKPLATDHEGLLLLLLNLADWLAGEKEPVHVVRTGEVVSVGGDIAPGENTATSPFAAGLEIVGDGAVEARRAGSYVLHSPRGEELVLANFFDARESDIGRAPAQPHRAKPRQGPEDAPIPGKGFGTWLLFLAAVLLLLEWFPARHEA